METRPRIIGYRLYSTRNDETRNEEQNETIEAGLTMQRRLVGHRLPFNSESELEDSMDQGDARHKGSRHNTLSTCSEIEASIGGSEARHVVQKKRSAVGRRISFTNENELENPMEQSGMQLTRQNSQTAFELDAPIEGAEARPTKKKTPRGPTVGASIWGRSEAFNDLEVNEYGQPIKKRATSFSTFVGTLSRKSEIVPLTIPDWRYVPLTAKDKIFKLCQEKFGFDVSQKENVLRRVADCWRKSKAKLKVKTFKKGQTVAAQAAARPSYIPISHWTALCHYWQTDKAKELREINKKNRTFNKMPHLLGRKTIACLREELRSPDGTAPSRADIWQYIRTNQLTKKPVNSDAEEAIAKIKTLQASQPNADGSIAHQDDVLAQALGCDSHGYVRGVGGGITAAKVFGPRRGSGLNLAAQVAETQAAREENTRLREQLEAQQEVISKLEEKHESQELSLVELRKMIEGLRSQNQQN